MSNYIPSYELKNAVHVAYKLSLPLLLTGEPGCGKTQCAYWIQGQAEQYKDVFNHLLRFDVKTTSSARDLFYRYDAIRHFRDASKAKSDVNILDYIHFTALGQAIIASSAKQRCVVLIDEIDKAPRDFPNDLLFEVENLKFRIEEATLHEIKDYERWHEKLELIDLGIDKPNFDKNGYFQCPVDETGIKLFQPFLLLTSNSEKNLPDAFMRRCAYFHLNFPEDTLDEILASQNWKLPPADILSIVKPFFLQTLKTGWRKTAGVAEMLNWLQYLGSVDLQTKEKLKQELKNAASLLAKNKEDNKQLEQLIDKLSL